MVRKKKKRRERKGEEEEGGNFSLTFTAAPTVECEVRIGPERITILEPIVADSLRDFMRWMQAAGLSVAFHHNNIIVAAGIMEDFHKRLYEDGDAVFSLLIVAEMEEYQEKLIEGGFQVEVFPAECSPMASLLGMIGEDVFKAFKLLEKVREEEVGEDKEKEGEER